MIVKLDETKVTKEERIRAAEAVARWHLGSRDWAHMIISAYNDPHAAMDALRAAKAKYE